MFWQWVWAISLCPVQVDLSHIIPSHQIRTRRITSRYRSPDTSETISYGLVREEFVTLAVYDVGRRLIRTMVSGRVGPGYYTEEWNGVDDRGQPVSSGVYFYRLEAGQ